MPAAVCAVHAATHVTSVSLRIGSKKGGGVRNRRRSSEEVRVSGTGGRHCGTVMAAQERSREGGRS